MNENIITVRDLIEELSKLDPTAIVICDEEATSGNTTYFEIKSVSVTDGVLGRDDNKSPIVKFGPAKNAVKIALISIQSDV